MRRIFVWLLALAAVTTGRGAPISTREVALMLRTGYSSETVLRDVAARKVVGTLDPATKKSLLEFGASSQLINALENGAFAASTSEAEAARQRDTDVAARRAAQIAENEKQAARAHTAAAQRPAPTVPAQSAGVAFAQAFDGKLVRCENGSIRPTESSSLATKKLIALYYSAHWCAPCRKFTPQLVAYYNRVKAAHPEFELVFVSSDRSRANWETYLRETQMPWLAIDFDKMSEFDRLKELGGDGIPSLLVLNQSGRAVASSYDGQTYVGPQKALADLNKIFAQGAAGPIAQAR